MAKVEQRHWDTIKTTGYVTLAVMADNLPRAVLFKGEPLVRDDHGMYVNASAPWILSPRAARHNGTPIEPLNLDDPQEWAIAPDVDSEGREPVDCWAHWLVYEDGAAFPSINPPDIYEITGGRAVYKRVTVCGLDLLRRTWLRVACFSGEAKGPPDACPEPDLPRAVLCRERPYVHTPDTKLYESADGLFLNRPFAANLPPIEPLNPADPQEWAIAPEADAQPFVSSDGNWEHMVVNDDGSCFFRCLPPIAPVHVPYRLAQYERVTVCGLDLLRRTWLREKDECSTVRRLKEAGWPEEIDMMKFRGLDENVMEANGYRQDLPRLLWRRRQDQSERHDVCPECDDRGITGMGPCSLCTTTEPGSPDIEPILRKCPRTGNLSLRLDMLSSDREVAKKQSLDACFVAASVFNVVHEGNLPWELDALKTAISNHWPRAPHLRAVKKAFVLYIKSQREGPPPESFKMRQDGKS